MKPKPVLIYPGLAIASVVIAVSCSAPVPESVDSIHTFASWDPASSMGEPLSPLVQTPENAAKVALGKKLFLEKRLSGDNTIACATCHSLDKGGTDQQVHSTGISGAQGGINAPTVMNAGLNFVQFWNGRAATLEDQVDGPPNNPKEMGSNWKQIVEKLAADSDYVKDFQEVYRDGPSKEHIQDAIATFERTLITLNAPFDRFLKGDQTALDDEQKHGYELFKEYGCVSCHQGQNVGGNLYEKFGVMGDYFKDRGTPMTDADLGRFAVTKREQDRYVFKVPSLRNLALTAPYFHDGSATTVPQAVEVMAQYQLGRPIDPDQLRAICRFLDSLNGDKPETAK